MKSMLALILCAALVPDAFASQGAARSALPRPIKLALDKRYPGWQFPPVSDEVRKFVGEYFSPSARPEFISGDFDGNGEQDYAVLVEHGKIYDGRGVAVGTKVRLVAFLKRGDRYKFHMVDPEGGGEYLFVMRRGEEDYDYETDKNFRYKYDTISAGIFSKAGTSYVYENGRFRAIITGD